MAQVIGVHGIAQEQLGRNQLLESWRPALADGIEIAAGPGTPIPSFDIAFYGDLFMSDEAAGSAVTKGLPDVADELSADDLAFISAAADELTEGDSADTTKGFGEVPGVLQPIFGRLARRYDLQALLTFVSALRQVRLYLRDDAMAETIRARVVRSIGDGCDVLIGHSLGSVVAFETVALNPSLRVRNVVTIGSPLAMKTVARHLRTADARADQRALPGQIRSWVNIFDDADPVASAGAVGRIWSDARDHTVGNGNQPHAATRYLAKRVSGATVLSGLTPVP